MTRTLYGIPNCDTVKKARDWLALNGVDYVFHDYKKQGVDRAALETWVDEHGWAHDVSAAVLAAQSHNPARALEGIRQLSE